MPLLIDQYLQVVFEGESSFQYQILIGLNQWILIYGRQFPSLLWVACQPQDVEK